MKSSTKSLLIITTISLLGLFNFFGSCIYDTDINYPKGTFPKTVTNLADLNSEYDEMNSGPPPSIHVNFNFYYSTNKASKGNNFDILPAYISYNFNMNNNDFYLRADEINVYNSFKWQLDSINTSFNEYGPFFSFTQYQYQFLFYSSDRNGKQDIFCLINNLYSSYYPSWEGPVPISILNSATANDGYLSIDSAKNTIYFSSDRENNYDIFMRKFPTNNSFYNWLFVTSSSSSEKVSELSSAYDDKMPYYNNNVIVFASNRPGGFGGYDLWYSLYQNGKWSDPVNFGNKINSIYDELRPVIMFDRDFTNDLLIFSSNRPEGKGGFDLYYTGIDKLIPD